jgi:phenylpropionate dioxygenase-like ring-hydroxylating dioxygenase large terminal subunit
MKVSEIGFLKDLWYAVARIDDVRARPTTVRLFGEEFVLWAPAEGAAVMCAPICPHRGAHLSAATVRGATLQCCYHGWQFDSSGACVHIPQLEPGIPVPSKARVRTYPVVERYGLCWACIGEPVSDGPPPWFEADELGWRVQVDFFEPWAAGTLRIVDNNIDQAHPAFVHQGTFGDPNNALVPNYDVIETPTGFLARVSHVVRGAGPQMGIDDEALAFERVTEVELLDAVHTRILLSYSELAPDYCFYGSATPIDDEHSMYVRVSALAGDEASQPYAMFHEFSRRVTLEDKVVLETTPGDFPLDVTAEVHLRCDKTTLAYRRYLASSHELGSPLRREPATR